VDTRQFSFDFMLPPPPPARPIAEALIAAGLVGNEFSLSLGLTNHDEVPAPSRLYQFPLEYFSPDREGVEGIYLRHPGLADLPFVKRVSEIVGFDVQHREEDEFGRAFGDLGHWWHAVDLMTKEHWRHLMETRHLTTDEDIDHAVQFGLEYGNINVEIARTILAELGKAEPEGRSRAMLAGDGMSPWLININSNNGKPIKNPTNWALNVRRFDGAAWMLVHGLEDGWFTRRRDGHLNLTPMAVAARAEAAQLSGQTL
jgi:hypothetical protein